MQYTLQRISSDFLSDGFLIFFENIEMSMELYNGEICCAAFSCHDLDTADGLPVLNGTTVVNAVYSIKLGVSQNRCHCKKGGHSLSMDAICKIVYTTKIHSVTSYCFKVFFLDDVALLCKCLNMF